MVNFKHMHAKLLQKRAAELSVEARKHADIAAKIDRDKLPHTFALAKVTAAYAQRDEADCYARARELAA